MFNHYSGVLKHRRISYDTFINASWPSTVEQYYFNIILPILFINTICTALPSILIKTQEMRHL